MTCFDTLSHKNEGLPCPDNPYQLRKPSSDNTTEERCSCQKDI